MKDYRNIYTNRKEIPMIRSNLVNITTQDEVFNHISNCGGTKSKKSLWYYTERIMNNAIKSSLLETEDLYRLTVSIKEKNAQISFTGDGTIVSESEW